MTWITDWLSKPGRVSTISQIGVWIILILGIALLFPYIGAWRLQDLRQHTTGFLLVFGVAFFFFCIFFHYFIGDFGF